MGRLARGEDSALNDLMQRHSERLFHYLFRSLQDEGDAADLAQETFVRAYQNRGRFDASQRFSTWIFTIASNLVRDRYRWRRRHPQVSLDAERDLGGETFGDALEGSGASPADQLEANERSDEVRTAVAALPDDLRLPLILAEYERLSHAEISSILGCTSKAVEMRIHRARLHLRASLRGLLEIR
jgi:RNA polymerase sigma-70 factor, ECF subfamily